MHPVPRVQLSMMPPSGTPPSPEDANHYRAVNRLTTSAFLLRLCLGRPIETPGTLDWAALFALAEEERLVGVAWSASGSFIRANAPGEVVSAWRRFVLLSRERALRQLRELSTIVEALRALGMSPVVLKGAPLSVRLYGDVGIRNSSDLDVLVPATDRAGARSYLEGTGWKVIEGRAPWTETFARHDEAGTFFLELHSSVLDRNLGHIRAPVPAFREETIEGVRIPAHNDEWLPASLAAHAAKHMPAALLYFVDFHFLWNSMDGNARSLARRSADSVGLGRYLAWMHNRAIAVEAAAEGDERALALLGVTPEGRRDVHAVFRDIALAPSFAAAAQSVAAWAWPPELRDDKRAFARRCVHRLRSSWWGHAVKTRGSAPAHRHRPRRLSAEP